MASGKCTQFGTSPLSIMEYSFCIRDSFTQLLPELFPPTNDYKLTERYQVELGYLSNDLFRCKTPMSLMTLCVRIALFIQSPNYSYITHIPQALNVAITRYYASSVFGDSESLIEHICKQIASFLVDEKQTYRWIYHSQDHATNAQFELYESGAICQAADTMTSDAVCVGLWPDIDLREQNLLCFQLYCFGKMDEMWIGICNKTHFGEDMWDDGRRLNHRITYYGGRYGSKDKRYFWDGYYGAIHGMTQLMQTHLEWFGEGDWITILIDTLKQKITFFKNQRFQSAISYRSYCNELGDTVMFYVLLDEIFDGF